MKKITKATLTSVIKNLGLNPDDFDYNSGKCLRSYKEDWTERDAELDKVVEHLKSKGYDFKYHTASYSHMSYVGFRELNYMDYLISNNID